jgi:homoserine dehydrogenase
VGSAVASRLCGPDSVSSLQLTHICDRRAHDKRGRQPAGAFPETVRWTASFDDLLASDTDIIVDALAGEPSGDSVRAALLTGKSVVTTSRQVMAHHGPALLTLAERQGRQLRFGAAVGGAMPIVRALEGLAGDRMTQLDAILSGVSNAVLSTMDETGCDMAHAVADACAKGYADLDPAGELDGTDAAAKLSVLVALAFGLRVTPSQIDIRPATTIDANSYRKARLRGGTIRQMAHASVAPGTRVLSVWVAPLVVPASSFFATTTGAGNAAAVVATHAGRVTLTGTGAGGEALAAAAVADLLTIARDRAAIVPAPVLGDPEDIRGLADLKLAEAV